MILEGNILTAVATTLTNGSALPQLIKTIKTRNTRSLSLPFVVILVCGLFVYEVMAVYTDQPVFAIGNGFGLCAWYVILLFKIKNRKKDKQGPPPFLDSLPFEERVEAMKKIGLYPNIAPDDPVKNNKK